MPSLAGAAFLVAALAFNTLAPVMTKVTQNEQGGYSYNKWCVYFFAELLKMAVAGAWSLHLKRTDPKAAAMMGFEWKENLRYTGPAFFFFAQNNLSFIGLIYLTNSAFQLLLNCRIVMVALATVIVLGKPVNAVEWVACILATTGAVQYNLAGCAEGSLRVNVMGILVMILIAGCAAGGNVYTQLVMQAKKEQPLMYQNLQLYGYGVLFNGVNWMLSLGVTANAPLFGEMGWLPVAAMFFYALYGLTISVILKQFGAMTRTFINATAIVFNGLLDMLFFGTPLTLSDATCFSVILCSAYLFANVAKDYKPPAAPAPAALEMTTPGGVQIKAPPKTPTTAYAAVGALVLSVVILAAASSHILSF